MLLLYTKCVATKRARYLQRRFFYMYITAAMQNDGSGIYRNESESVELKMTLCAVFWCRWCILIGKRIPISLQLES